MNILKEKRCSGRGNQTEIALVQKWKHGINLIDQLIVNKRLILKWFYFSIFTYTLYCIVCSTIYFNICSYIDKITKPH